MEGRKVEEGRQLLKEGRKIENKIERVVLPGAVHQFLTTILTLRSSALEHKHLSWSSVTSLAF